MTKVSTSVVDVGRKDTQLTGRVLVAGFGTAVVMWCAAFLAHLPWLDLPSRVTGPAVLVCWLLGAVYWGRITAGPRSVFVGALAGIVTAVLGLLILGSLLTEQPAGPTPAPGLSGLQGGAYLYIPGFLLLGTVIGLGAGLAARGAAPPGRDWLSTFAIVTVAAIAPLLLTGGAVTSTNSGMAIRGWPNSDAANMFLYPIGLMADPQRFLEHTHRLFGSLVGMTCITLLVYTLIAGRSGRVKAAAAVLLAAVIAQGVLGGLRVIENERVLALVHGISAQLILGLAAGIAVSLRPGFRAPASRVPGGRGLATASAWLVAATVLQLSLGAVYRHLREPHAVYTHAAFSLVIVVLAMIVGARAVAAAEEGDAGPVRVLRRCGKALRHTVLLQFVLGCITLATILLSGHSGLPDPVPGGGAISTPPFQAAVTTAHQAVGALLLALTVVTAMWTRRLAAPGTATP
ncbi:MAG: COX15/CtaA family protein [Phycisphaerales bacterium]|nr:COX15/CtaA family protein [Phycisphaerales bacterium]